MNMASKTKPLSLSETLRDLALLRAADVNLASVLSPDESSPPTTALTTSQTVDASVQESFEFAREARAVVRMLHRGDVDKEGRKIDEMRGLMQEVLDGLSDTAQQ